MKSNNNILNAILALAVLDIASDIAFLNALLNGKKEEKDDLTFNDRHPLIGMQYIVTDNSYAIDKETGISVSGLHGKKYTIVSDPYKEQIDSKRYFIDEGIEHLFIDVFSVESGRKYRVLFQERNIVNPDNPVTE